MQSFEEAWQQENYETRESRYHRRTDLTNCESARNWIEQVFRKPIKNQRSVLLQFCNQGMWTDKIEVIDVLTTCKNQHLCCSFVCKNGTNFKVQIKPDEHYFGPFMGLNLDVLAEHEFYDWENKKQLRLILHKSP
jgi:hypothetical protein